MILRCIVVAVICSFACPAAALAAAGDPALDNEERALCRQINTYRAQNRLPALRLSVALTRSSKWLSASMARLDYFDHTDNLGRSFSRRISASGYGGATRGENIAAGTNGSAAAMFSQWKNSAPHRRNLLSSSFKVLGVGRAYSAGSMYGWYWTTDFGGTVDRTIPC